jgi:hypothetical protein
MSDAVVIAIIGMIAASGTVLSPVILSHMSARARRAEKQLDWAREDKVAAQAAEAASLLLAANERVARTAEGVAKTARVTNAKLDVIHTLVDGSMTAAMQSELDATVRELTLMREVAGLRRAAGHDPSAEALAAIDATVLRIAELKTKLADRLTQVALAEQQQDEQRRDEQRRDDDEGEEGGEGKR